MGPRNNNLSSRINYGLIIGGASTPLAPLSNGGQLIDPLDSEFSNSAEVTLPTYINFCNYSAFLVGAWQYRVENYRRDTRFFRSEAFL